MKMKMTAYGLVTVGATVGAAVILPDLTVWQAFGGALLGAAGVAWGFGTLTIAKRRWPATFDAFWKGV